MNEDTKPNVGEMFIHKGTNPGEPVTIVENFDTQRRSLVRRKGSSRKSSIRWDVLRSHYDPFVVTTIAPIAPAPTADTSLAEIVRVAVATAMAEHERRYHGAKQLTLVPNVAT